MAFALDLCGRHDIVSQMTNLYNVGKSLDRNTQSRSEANRLYNQIAQLKVQKIRLAHEIDDFYLELHKTQNPRG